MSGSAGRTILMVNHPVDGGGWVATHEDITDRRRTEVRLAEEANENRRLFETSLDLILVTDRYGNIERISPISSAILGYRPEEMVGRNAINFVFPDDLEAVRKEMKLARSGCEIRNFETRYVHKNGQAKILAWSGVWSAPEQRHFFTGRDITERKLAEDKLKHLAHHDELTGLANRVSLMNDLGSAFGLDATESGYAHSVVMFDLDGFKDINDMLGHSTGDQLLQAVAQRMTGRTAALGRFYRLGGDEFVFVRPNSGDPLEIASLADKVLKCFAPMSWSRCACDALRSRLPADSDYDALIVYHFT